MARIVAPALKELLTQLIDYAGVFPPATLSRDVAIAKYKDYRNGEYAWMLRWFVIGAAELEHVPSDLDGLLAVLSDADHSRAAVIETKQIVRGERPAYCEVSLQNLDQVKQAGCFGKIRTGGVKLELIPPVEEVAAFIVACAERRLPFKATAGLHHPIRAIHPLTYEADAPRAMMHGFMNVFVAAAFAWHGRRDIEPILAETDIKAFRFDQRAHWRDLSLNADQVREARTQFAHSFGSCSFDEPVHDLQGLGLL